MGRVELRVLRNCIWSRSVESKKRLRAGFTLGHSVYSMTRLEFHIKSLSVPKHDFWEQRHTIVQTPPPIDPGHWFSLSLLIYNLFIAWLWKTILIANIFTCQFVHRLLVKGLHHRNIILEHRRAKTPNIVWLVSASTVPPPQPAADISRPIRHLRKCPMRKVDGIDPHLLLFYIHD